MRTKIHVKNLTRVEGEASLTLRFKGDDLEKVELRIFEPPRFFEAFLRGRSQLELPDLTARICGICPVAYQLASCTAIESALGVEIPEPISNLRRLLLAGEWVESHALHVFFLHAPDFFGLPDGIALAKQLPDRIRMGLRLKQVGNRIMRVLGGREIHPVNVRAGGFYRTPTKEELLPLLEDIEWAKTAACETVRWVASFPFPDVERDYVFVSTAEESAYPMLGRRVAASNGLEIPVEDYENHFVEEHVTYTTALHSTLRDRVEYLCGPLARFNLGFEKLAPQARDAAREVGMVPPCRNPAKSIILRAIEMLHAMAEAERIVASYEPPAAPFVEVPQSSMTGFGCVEAPRGLLYQRYVVDESGIIREAKIVPPTSQNQKVMESDVAALGRILAVLPKEEASLLAERAIRNHDPCISCATHFLKLEVEKT